MPYVSVHDVNRAKQTREDLTKAAISLSVIRKSYENSEYMRALELNRTLRTLGLDLSVSTMSIRTRVYPDYPNLREHGT